MLAVKNGHHLQLQQNAIAYDQIDPEIPYSLSTKYDRHRHLQLFIRPLPFIRAHPRRSVVACLR